MDKQKRSIPKISTNGFIEQFEHISVYLDNKIVDKQSSFCALCVHDVVSIKEINKLVGETTSSKNIEIKLSNGKTISISLFGDKGLFPLQESVDLTDIPYGIDTIEELEEYQAKHREALK